jgi:hypothetical protein
MENQYKNSSPSTSTPPPEPLSIDERVWGRDLIRRLPPEIAKTITDHDVMILTRQDPTEWPPELMEKVQEHLDFESESEV